MNASRLNAAGVEKGSGRVSVGAPVAEVGAPGCAIANVMEPGVGGAATPDRGAPDVGILSPSQTIDRRGARSGARWAIPARAGAAGSSTVSATAGNSGVESTGGKVVTDWSAGEEAGCPFEALRVFFRPASGGALDAARLAFLRAETAREDSRALARAGEANGAD